MASYILSSQVIFSPFTPGGTIGLKITRPRLDGLVSVIIILNESNMLAFILDDAVV